MKSSNFGTLGAAAAIVGSVAVLTVLPNVASAEDLSPAQAAIAAPGSSAVVDGQTLSPTLVATGDDSFGGTGGTSLSSFSSDPTGALTVGSMDRSLTLSPLGVHDSAGAGRLIAGGDALRFEETQDATDTTVRPTADGAEIYLTLKSNSAPSSYRWRVALLPGDRLLSVAPQLVAVVAPGASSTTAESSETAPPGGGDAGQVVESANDPDVQVAQAAKNQREADAAIGDNEHVVGVIAAPSAEDADGSPIPVTLGADDDVVTLDVPHSDTSSYPIVADPSVGGYQVSTALASWCASGARVRVCLEGLGLGQAAEKSMLQHYPRAANMGRGDAFRHCFWNDLMQSRIGGPNATSIATLHEAGQPRDFSFNMDMNNNHFGREFDLINGEAEGGRACLRDSSYGYFLIFKNHQ